MPQPRHGKPLADDSLARMVRTVKDEALLRVLLVECLFGRGKTNRRKLQKAGSNAAPGKRSPAGGVVGGGALANAVNKHAFAIVGALDALVKVSGKASPLELLPIAARSGGRKARPGDVADAGELGDTSLPRYARLNPLRGVGFPAASDAASLAGLLAAGRTAPGEHHSGDEQKSAASAVDAAASRLKRPRCAPCPAPVASAAVLRDTILPRFVAFPAGSDLHDHPLVRSGAMVLQDRASGLPVTALLRSPGHPGVWPPPPGGPVVAVDATAAPGSKTSQLAAELAVCIASGWGEPLPSGAALRAAGWPAGGDVLAVSRAECAVFAMERDPKRLEVLRGRMEHLGCGALVQTVRGDFLQMRPAGVPAAAGGAASPPPASPPSSSSSASGASNRGGSSRVQLDTGTGRIDCVVLDPSCSGSGMAARRLEMMHSTASSVMQASTATATVPAAGEGCSPGKRARPGEAPAAVDAASAPGTGPPTAPSCPAGQRDKVEGLSRFQRAALLHALGMPGCRRVVYSTCSVWGEENEGVVAHVLGKAPVGRSWRLAHALPDWPTRGNLWPGITEEEAACLLRAGPATDQTQGFFVALFERRPEALKLDL